MKTFKMGSLSRLPARRDAVPVVVEYASADAFLADYAANLRNISSRIARSRDVCAGTIVDVHFSFPGLAKPIVLPALVQSVEAATMTIALLAGAGEKLEAIIEQVKSRDPNLVLRHINTLIVEDNSHIRVLLQRGLRCSTRNELRNMMFTFEHAENGADALDLLKSYTFDLAIVDVYLPVLDGPAMIKQARTTLGIELPFIMLSGGGDSARAAALSAGASVFLAKPIRLSEVVSSLRRLIN